MPFTFARTFRIRHYECDAYGHVNHANYLRFMQETAFDGSAACGYGMARYNEMGLMWLIRQSAISYERPLRYGDSVVVKTWVGNYRRVRSRRMYELRHATTGELVASGYSDWVLLDRHTLQPVTIPQEILAAFFPEGIPEPAPHADHFPEPPPPPPGIFTMRRVVEWRDLDTVGHVNNANYLVFAEEAGMGVAVAHGWPMGRMLADGFGIVAREYRIEYRQPALLGEELEVATWISDVKRASAVRHYTITRVRDGALLARARALWVWVNLGTGRPTRIPAGLLADFQANIATSG